MARKDAAFAVARFGAGPSGTTPLPNVRGWIMAELGEPATAWNSYMARFYKSYPMYDRDRPQFVNGFVMINPDMGQVLQKAMELNSMACPNALADAQQQANDANENMLWQAMRTATAGEESRRKRATQGEARKAFIGQMVARNSGGPAFNAQRRTSTKC